MMPRRVLAALSAAFALVLLVSAPVAAQAPAPAARVDRDVVYGMYSGLALLMDVHRPAAPNGTAIVAITGIGFHAGGGYGAAPMKEIEPQLNVFVKPLVAAGYTVFVINHRAAPAFRYPAAIEDAERAVRFVRHYATRFAISPDRIGAVGASSGGYLASMLGVRSGPGAPDDDDAVNREPARVQAVVAYCPPEDLTGAFNDFGVSAIAAFMGILRPSDPASAEFKMYRQASPIASVSADDAPILLIHGDQDQLVPIAHSEKMEAALRGADVPVKLIRVTGSGHLISQKPEYPDFTTEMVRWFDVHLRK